MFLPSYAPSSLILIDHPLITEKKLTLWIKRDDLLHPALMGNKYRKSLIYFKQAAQSQIKTIVSFGGQYSNHLLALAAMGASLNIQTVGCIRGDANISKYKVLQRCYEDGMHLISINPSQYYAQQTIQNDALKAQLNDFGLYSIIPEGGTSSACLNDVANVVSELMVQQAAFDYLISPIGTGGTAAGLLIGLHRHQLKAKVVGMLALKGYQSLPEQGLNALKHYAAQHQIDLLTLMSNLELQDASYGGFAKTNLTLNTQLSALQRQIEIPLDYVYTGKALLKLFELIAQDYFKADSKLIFLHTGGYQTSPVN